LAEWLRSGLQSRLHRFDSGRRLSTTDLNAGGYQGHPGLRQYVRDLGEAWRWYHVEIHSLRDLGNDVLMEGRLEATGRSSGLEVKEDMAWLHTFRAGTGPAGTCDFRAASEYFSRSI
jgi:ketosteroid isomerase-like protein